MADKRFDVVELKGNNYQRWRNDLQVALIFAKCSETIEFEECPENIEDADWNRMCTNARAIILKSLRDDYWRVSQGDTPFQAMRKIENALQPTSSLITILNICKFFALSNGAQGQDIEKEIRSTYSELRRSIEASDALRERIIIDESVRTAILAFALEKTDPGTAQQIKDRFERSDITFEQALSLLAEQRVSYRAHITGTPTVAAAAVKEGCTFCKGRHSLSKCWFNDPSLAPERLRGKICTKCKSVGHSTKDCNGEKEKANFLSDQDKYCFGLSHVVLVSATSSSRPTVILDSGCTIHMMPTREIFKDYNSGSPDNVSSVFTASGQSLAVLGHGSVSFEIKNHRSKRCHTLLVSGVLHVPDLRECILSVSTLDRKGIEITTSNGKSILRLNGKFIASAHLNEDIQQYCLDYQKI
tara:strand:- start:84 stop:1328 length:1245 start_codon:yes stop_codon:yes gene_type:complete